MFKKALFITVAMLISINAMANKIDPITPIGFEVTDENKAEVIAFINKNVERIFCVTNKENCKSVFVANKKQEDLDAFKKLMEADKTIVKDLIVDHCRYDFSNCRYSEMLTDYNKLIKPTSSELSW